jgi:hypothetical protein
MLIPAASVPVANTIFSNPLHAETYFIEEYDCLAVESQAEVATAKRSMRPVV